MQCRYKNFGIVEPTFVEGYEKPDAWYKYNFSVVKYQKEEDSDKEHCFTIATLSWNKEAECFKFTSCGLRYLQEREDNLEKWLYAFCKMKEVEFEEEKDV